MNPIRIQKLSLDNLSIILPLVQKINPTKTLEDLQKKQTEMFNFDHYHCFGVFQEGHLIGLSSAWITVRFYSGKQLEVDNLMVDPELQSKGFGKFLMEFLEKWAKENGCLTVELNTYVFNERSHKFYFNQGYKIIGYHFQKNL